MTQTQEFNGASVEKAVEKASAALGLSVGDLSYKVVDAGSEGFLGIGARDARIAVEVPEPGEVGRELADASGSLELAEVFGEPAEAENLNVPDGLLAEIEDLVSSVVGAMGFESRIDVYDTGSFIAVDVAPDNTGLFIGQKGETIDALQYLVNAAVYRKRPFLKRIILDAEGYRQRRVEAIQGIAYRTARRAIRERRAVELPPMSPSERRIVHMFLSDNPEVTTASEGSGEDRRVRISPT
jgi:spoIIIJ-associated protein